MRVRIYNKTIPNKGRCYFCKDVMHIASSEYFMVCEATKPPRTPHRWENVGVACDDCGGSNDTHIDPWKNKSYIANVKSTRQIGSQ